MAEYIDKTQINYYELERNGETLYMVWKPHIDMIPVADVVEKEQLNEANARIEELEENNEYLCSTNAQLQLEYNRLRSKYKDLRSKIDKAIEEIKDNSFVAYRELDEIGSTMEVIEIKELLEILKRNIGE